MEENSNPLSTEEEHARLSVRIPPQFTLLSNPQFPTRTLQECQHILLEAVQTNTIARVGYQLHTPLYRPDDPACPDKNCMDPSVIRDAYGNDLLTIAKHINSPEISELLWRAWPADIKADRATAQEADSEPLLLDALHKDHRMVLHGMFDSMPEEDTVSLAYLGLKHLIREGDHPKHVNTLLNKLSDNAKALTLSALSGEFPSVLHLAAFHGRMKTAQRLLKHGADPTSLSHLSSNNSSSNTLKQRPFEVARKAGHHLLSQILKDAIPTIIISIGTRNDGYR